MAGLDGKEGQTIQVGSLFVPNANEDDGRHRKTRNPVNATPDPAQMPIATFKAGCTPADRSKADKNEISRSIVKVVLGYSTVKLFQIRTSGAQPRIAKSGGSVTTATVGTIGTVFGVDAGYAT